MRFRFDTFSFFMGMIVATLIWWMVTIMRPLFERILEFIKYKQKEYAQKKNSGLRGAYLKILFRQTQEMHIASSLFALDEIVQTPRLLAPPIIFDPGSSHCHINIVEQSVPYLPEFPELDVFYSYPTLTLPEALQGGTNIAILGNPGTGKTTALAYLASSMARSSSDNILNGFTPFLIHVAELGIPLNKPKKPQDFLKPIIENIIQRMGVFDAQQMPNFIEHIFSNGKALLLLDGIDELPQSAIHEANDYVRIILRLFPHTRIVVTGTPEYLNGILSLGFTPLTIMPWSNTDQDNFLKNWSDLWQKKVLTENWAQQTDVSIDQVLLNRWLSVDNFGLSPLEFTLKIWGGYAGDIISTKPIDIIEAHIRRLLPANVSSEAASMLAYQSIVNESPIFDGRRAWEWIKTYEPVDIAKTSTQSDAADNPENPPQNEENAIISSSTRTSDPKQIASAQTPQLNKSSIIASLTHSGILSSHADNRHRFSHLIFLGYFSGKCTKSNRPNTDAIAHQSAWSGQTNFLRFVAAFEDITDIVNVILAQEDPILYRPIFLASRLLRDAKQFPRAAWRDTVITTLVKILREDDFSIGLRGKALAALALSGETNINALFRQLLQEPSNELRQLAALGCGLMRDPKAIDTLASMVDNSLETTRQAACLALVEIGSPQALEAVAVYLLHGDEQLRIYSAEALANHETDGHEALREGIKSSDILLRRAVVYGLSRLEESWATELLEDIQLNDEQWAVRNVAIEFLQTRQKPNPRIPQILPPLHETPWLIEFAGRYGMGISPGQPATHILLLALKDNNQDFLQPALRLLRTSPTEEVLAALYPHLFGTDPHSKEFVFQTLSYIALGGVSLPESRKFGLG